jgi:amidase
MLLTSRLLHSDTEPEEYKDMPLCVQIVGYRHRDEALMQTAAILDAIINEK